jgi:hypothetical protein
MTSMDTIGDKAVTGAENVDASKKEVVDSTVRTYSKPFDVTARDNAKIAAEKAVIAAKKLDLETREKTHLDTSNLSKTNAGTGAEKEVETEEIEKLDANVTCHQ